ncbi:MAG TPA: hypothetical protein PLP11_01640 [Bacteroidales bacterium]|nr:hypothetical protein [Bacteroidales bacterium]
MKSITVSFILLFLYSFLFAQNTEFKVYFSAGNVYLKNKGASSYVTRDTPLAENSVICISRDAYVVLINKAEMPMVISEEGEYSMRKITNLYSKLKESNLTDEFFAYIAGQMFKSEDKKYVGGGVYKMVEPEMEGFSKKPDPGSCIMDTVINFEWFYYVGETTYLKIVDAKNDSLVCVISTSAYSASLSISTCNLIRGKTYLWSVEDTPGLVKEKESLSVLKLAGPDDISDFNARLLEIENTVSNPKMRKLAKIRLYVDNNIYPMPDYSNF